MEVLKEAQQLISKQTVNAVEAKDLPLLIEWLKMGGMTGLNDADTHKLVQYWLQLIYNSSDDPILPIATEPPQIQSYYHKMDLYSLYTALETLILPRMNSVSVGGVLN